MSIHGQGFFTTDVLPVVAREPVRERVIEVLDAFSSLAVREAYAALSGFVRNDHGETLVPRAGPYGRFAQAGEAKYRDPSAD